MIVPSSSYISSLKYFLYPSPTVAFSPFKLLRYFVIRLFLPLFVHVPHTLSGLNNKYENIFLFHLIYRVFSLLSFQMSCTFVFTNVLKFSFVFQDHPPDRFTHPLYHDHKIIPAFIHILDVFPAKISPVQDKSDLLIAVSFCFF